jgi:hypothetical protein
VIISTVFTVKTPGISILLTSVHCFKPLAPEFNSFFPFAEDVEEMQLTRWWGEGTKEAFLMKMAD